MYNPSCFKNDLTALVKRFLSTMSKIIKKLSCLGIRIDEEKNNEENNPLRGKIRKISADDSSTLVYVIPTNEELVMARDTLRIVTNR